MGPCLFPHNRPGDSCNPHAEAWGQWSLMESVIAFCQLLLFTSHSSSSRFFCLFDRLRELGLFSGKLGIPSQSVYYVTKQTAGGFTTICNNFLFQLIDIVRHGYVHSCIFLQILKFETRHTKNVYPIPSCQFGIRYNFDPIGVTISIINTKELTNEPLF